MPEGELCDGEEPMPVVELDDPLFWERHSQASLRVGPKLEDAKQEAANSGYGRGCGVHDSTQVH